MSDSGGRGGAYDADDNVDVLELDVAEKFAG